MSQQQQVAKQVIVLGAATEADLVAHGLGALGYEVRWVRTGDLPAALSGTGPHVTAYSGFQLVGLDGHVGSFAARLQRDGQMESVGGSALVVATGNERYYPSECYGLPLGGHVLTVPQMLGQLTGPSSTGAAAPHRNQRYAFMLDLGGQSSKETSTEALKVAFRLRRRWHSEVYVFYQNLQVDAHDLESLTREMRDGGVVFCRYASPKVAAGERGVEIRYEEGTLGVDVLVLPEAVRPAPGTQELAEKLRVRVGEDGYLQEINIRQYRPGLTMRKGIFVTGRCHLDGDDQDVRADATQAVANVDALLGTGAVGPEDTIAHVDADKCIRCLTCVRSCPHSAVEIAQQQDVVAACVVDLACRGCGACVANCPVRAIELVSTVPEAPAPVPAWLR